MDLSKLNEAAAKVKATSIKDLSTTNSYIVTALREVAPKEKNWGEKIIADLDSGDFIYLPSNVVRHLKKNPAELMLLQEAANKLKLIIRPLGGFKIMFETI